MRISSIVRGTKLTARPSSVPSWRTDCASLGIWFVQMDADIHSVRRPVTRSSAIGSCVDVEVALPAEDDDWDPIVKALLEPTKATMVAIDDDRTFILI